MIDVLFTSFVIGVLYSFFTIGLANSFRVLNYPDLTLEGSAIFGGAICFKSLFAGVGPLASTFLGALAGSLAGAFTAIQYLYLNVSKLLSGIITTAILYSINIRLLGGKSNAYLGNDLGLFNQINLSGKSGDLLILVVIAVIMLLFLYYLYSTRLGYTFRIIGDNATFLKTLKENPKIYTIIGLMLSNFIIGLGGGILVQYKNVCDVNLSFGLLISSLAAIMLGEIFSPKRMATYHISNIVGTIIYSLVIGLVMYSWSPEYERLIMASDVRMITGLLLIIPSIFFIRLKKYSLFKSDW